MRINRHASGRHVQEKYDETVIWYFIQHAPIDHWKTVSLGSPQSLEIMVRSAGVHRDLLDLALNARSTFAQAWNMLTEDSP